VEVAETGPMMVEIKAGVEGTLMIIVVAATVGSP
jgi:hypothetical protein